MKKNVLSVVLAALCSSVWASNSNDSAIEMTLVTASRLEQPVHKALAAVTVINRAEIEQSPALHLADLLARLPGIDYSNSGGRGSDSSLFMRGTSSDHTLILVDGVRTSSATSGKSALQRIPLDQIERIEVVRGPRSSLYGAEAIGGVIQIFTRQPQGGSLSTEVGSFDARKISLALGGGDDTQYRMTANHEKTTGYDNTAADGTVNDDNDGYEEQALSLSLRHRFSNDWQLGVSGSLVDARSEYDSGADDYVDSLNQSIIGRLAAPLGDQLALSVELANYRDERENFGSNVSVFDTERSSASAQFDYRWQDDQVITAGYDYYDDKVASSSSFVEDSRDNSAYFLQYQAETEHLLMSASFRSDDNQSFGRNNTRSFSGGYKLSENSLLALSYGTAFKAPTFNDLYFPFTDYGFFSYQGNINLRPEQSESWELMLRSNWQGVNWSASYYQTDISNLISYQAGSPGTVNNISEVEISGAELNADVSLLGWQLASSLSYTDPRDQSNNELIENRARSKVTAAVSRDFGKLGLALNWMAQSHRFSDDQRLAGYNTVDITARYTFSQALQLTAKCNNLFDKDYAVNKTSRGLDYKTPGLNFSLALNYRFGV
jgi:vitamin B12 transporter